MKNKTIKLLLVILFVFSILVLIIDYFNLFSYFGMNMEYINWDLSSIVITNMVVIALFGITYILIDSRNIQKDKNQRDIAYLTLIEIYEECKDMVDLFSQEENRKIASEKVDGNKLAYEDSAHMHYLNYPFENESLIYDFASSGIIPKDVFSDFLSIKKDYQKYITAAIVFYDMFDSFKTLEDDLNKKIDANIKQLKECVDKD